MNIEQDIKLIEPYVFCQLTEETKTEIRNILLNKGYYDVEVKSIDCGIEVYVKPLENESFCYKTTLIRNDEIRSTDEL